MDGSGGPQLDSLVGGVSRVRSSLRCPMSAIRGIAIGAMALAIYASHGPTVLVAQALRRNPVVRDSAGISIVENKPSVADVFSLAALPRLSIRIGRPDGPIERNRSQAAELPANGLLVVTPAIDGRVAWARYDSAGHRYDFDSSAHPPVHVPTWIRRVGHDTLVMWVFPENRFCALDLAGRQVAGLSYRNPDPAAGVVDWATDAAGILDDGAAFLGWRAAGVSTAGTLSRKLVDGWLYYLSGREPVHLGMFSSGESFSWVQRDSAAGSIMLTFPAAAFARDVHIRLWGDRIYVGTGESYEIDVLSRQGMTTRIIRSLRPMRPVTAADVVAFRASSPSALGSMGEARLDNALPTVPAFSRIEVDDSGQLWVRDFRADAGLQEWTAFDPDGLELGRLTIPVSSEVLAFGRSEVILSAADGAANEWIRVYAIIRK